MFEREKIEEIVREAGRMILGAHLEKNEIHHKPGETNFVTDHDLKIQRFLIGRLSELFPDASFFGEEDTEKSVHRIDAGYTFFLDPIDGTTNFLFDYSNSCVSVGLSDNGSMIAGWVYNPYADAMYSAVRGKGAKQNDRMLKLADKGIEEGICAFGCARYNDHNADLLFDVVKEMYLSSLSIRNGGSAAIDLCRVAGGGNVGYFQLVLEPYDYAAASIIIEEAGGVITQADGSPITLDKSCSVVAGTKKAADEIRRIYSRFIS